jgi:hypothetical protein
VHPWCGLSESSPLRNGQFHEELSHSKSNDGEMPGSLRETFLNCCVKYISIRKTHDLIVGFADRKQNDESMTECASAPVHVEGGGGLFELGATLLMGGLGFFSAAPSK